MSYNYCTIVHAEKVIFQVSQNWFNERQRIIATTVLGLSNPIGLVLGQGVTPILVSTPEDIPIMNIVWFMPALIGSILTFFSVNRPLPPTPPSRELISLLQ